MVAGFVCLLAVGGYLLGSFPTAVLVAGRRGVDPTAGGSGNPGATNVYRLAGRRAGAAVIGHCYPPNGRRGGKGVATFAGFALAVVPVPALAAGAVWLVAAASSRRAALGSVAAAVTVPIAAAVAGRPGPEIAIMAVIGALVVARHRDNLARLVRGEQTSLH